MPSEVLTLSLLALFTAESPSEASEWPRGYHGRRILPYLLMEQKHTSSLLMLNLVWGEIIFTWDKPLRLEAVCYSHQPTWPIQWCGLGIRKRKSFVFSNDWRFLWELIFELIYLSRHEGAGWTVNVVTGFGFYCGKFPNFSKPNAHWVKHFPFKFSDVFKTINLAFQMKSHIKSRYLNRQW